MDLIKYDAAITDEFAYSQAIGAKIVNFAKGYAAIVVVTNSTPAGGNFTSDATTDKCSLATHGFKTGLKVQLTTTTTLPAPLTTSTDYFVIEDASSTFKLATSLANAKAGIAIDITDTGTGTHTVTPTSLAGASLKLQGSLDGITYADLPIKGTGDATKSASITASANFYLDIDDLKVNYVQIYYALTAGQLSISQTTRLDRK